MADVVYNPLLKRNIQYLGGGSGDNSQKVTKFFFATDTLENGEIAQYQGVSDTDNNLINGFFYKVDVTPITIIPAGTPYFYFTKPFESDVFNIIANDRYYLIESNVFTLNNNFAWSPDNPAFFYPYQYIEPATIGNPVYCQALKQYKFITAINGDTIVCDDISFIYGGHLVGPFTFSKYINQNGQVIFVSPGAGAVIYQHNNLQYGFAPIVLSPTPSINQGTTNQQITLGGNKFTRVDTQPNNSYTLPTAAANVLGGVKIGPGLSIDENGVLSSSGGGNIPMASPSVLGGIKVGDFAFEYDDLLYPNGLSIDDNGVLSIAPPTSLYREDINEKIWLFRPDIFLIGSLVCGSLGFEVRQPIASNTALFQLECWPPTGDMYRVFSNYWHEFLGFKYDNTNNVVVVPSSIKMKSDDNFIYSASDLSVGRYLVPFNIPIYLATLD